eukprot:scpid101937/ scgid12640/ 
MSNPSVHPGSSSSGSGVYYASKPATNYKCNCSQDEPWVDAFTACRAAGKTGISLQLREIWLDSEVMISMRVDSGSCVTILPRSKVPAAYTLTSAPFRLRPLGANAGKPVVLPVLKEGKQGCVLTSIEMIRSSHSHPDFTKLC